MSDEDEDIARRALQEHTQAGVSDHTLLGSLERRDWSTRPSRERFEAGEALAQKLTGREDGTPGEAIEMVKALTEAASVAEARVVELENGFRRYLVAVSRAPNNRDESEIDRVTRELVQLLFPPQPSDQNGTDEITRLRAALEQAGRDLQFHLWKGDPGSDKRFAAVQRVRKALGEQ
jgi:hypothetical protein